MNKNCALKLVNEIILYYDAWSKKHQITKYKNIIVFFKLMKQPLNQFIEPFCNQSFCSEMGILSLSNKHSQITLLP